MRRVAEVLREIRDDVGARLWSQDAGVDTRNVLVARHVVHCAKMCSRRRRRGRSSCSRIRSTRSLGLDELDMARVEGRKSAALQGEKGPMVIPRAGYFWHSDLRILPRARGM
jgi:hypothetical protein